MASHDRTLPVAVFDSGVGGLTVLHECLVSLPHEDFLYLGDTARFPYGDRAPEELLGFARELAGILLERGAKLLVVACNSATAAALPALRKELELRVPVVGVVRPESRLAAAATRNGRVGLIATPATVVERRLRPRPRRGGSWGRAPHRGLGRARAADPEGRRCRPPRAHLCRGCMPAAQARRGGHGDPWLHPLSAGEAGAPARARTRRDGRQLRRGDRGRRRGAPARGRRGKRRGPPRELPLPRHRPAGRVPPRRDAVPPAADRSRRARGRAPPAARSAA